MSSPRRFVRTGCVSKSTFRNTSTTPQNMKSLLARSATPALALALAFTSSSAQQRPAQPPQGQVPPALQAERREDPRVAPARHEGEGPYGRLIIRGATLIDGTGGPPRGPVDVIVEGNRITNIAN